MRKKDCDHLNEARRSKVSLSSEERRHIESCEICSDARVVDRGLRSLVATIEWPPLPEAGALWLKARLFKMRTESARLNRPLDLAQNFSWIVLSIAWGIVLAWQVPSIVSWARNLEPQQFVTGGVDALPFSVQFVWIFAGLLAMTFTVLFHGVVQHD